ncbi:pyridoxal phosphate-dependent aminotransferase [bacterium]|nr:pyridoxal phosphate-dependent aminotransferase [bacterium]
MKYDFDSIISRKDEFSAKYRMAEKRVKDINLIPLSIADMEFETAPEIKEAILKRANHGIYGYTYLQKNWFESIINWTKKRYNWNIKKEYITFSPGVVSAINIAIQTFTDMRDRIIIQPPVYPPFFSSITNNKRQVVKNPLKVDSTGRFQIDFDDLEQKLNHRVKAILISNPHNPTGNVWSREELQKIGEFAIKYDLIILSDEIHADIIFGDKKHTPIASISEEIADRTITFISPSKTFNLAGLTTAVTIITNPELKRDFDFTLEQLHLKSGNIFGNIALDAAYSNGEDWLEELLIYLKGNIDFTIDFFKKELPKVKTYSPDGTFMLWLDFSDYNHPSINKLLLEKEGVHLMDGAWFGGSSNFQRMNIATPKETLKEALERIRDLFNSYDFS